MSDLRNPLQRARGAGSARSGVQHWWRQRVTATALFFLGIWFLLLVLALMHGGYDAARTTLAHPVNAALMVAFVIALFWHLQLGVQVIIEDYVHTPLLGGIAHLANIFVCALAAIAGVLAIVRIALGS